MPKCFGCSNAEPYDVEDKLDFGGISLEIQRCQVCGLRYACAGVDSGGESWVYWVPVTRTEADDLTGDPTPAALLELMDDRTYYVQQSDGAARREKDGTLCEALKGNC